MGMSTHQAEDRLPLFCSRNGVPPGGLRAEGRQRVRRQNSSGRPLSQSASVGHWKFLSPWTVSLLPEQACQSWMTCWGGVRTPDRGWTWTKAETPAGVEIPSLAHGAGALEWVAALFPGVRNAQGPNGMLSTQGKGVLCLPFAIRRVKCCSGTHPLPSSPEHHFKVKKRISNTILPAPPLIRRTAG